MKDTLFTPFSIPKSSFTLNPFDELFLIGSCFSENMSQRLQQNLFYVMSNPYGILFDPLGIESCINDIFHQKIYDEQDLFYANELWASWSHHTRFSFTDKQKSIDSINQEIKKATNFLQSTKAVIITLGSAFSYYHTEEKRFVANCHKIGQSNFKKELITIDTIAKSMTKTIDNIKMINPTAQIVFTISPVRHLRDGVIENNRSKARLIEAVHQIVSSTNGIYYFPAYELVIDILRDYRFFDIDFAHPNILATNIVYEHLIDWCVTPKDKPLLDALNSLSIASRHKALHPDTQANRNFIISNLEKAKQFKANFPKAHIEPIIEH